MKILRKHFVTNECKKVSEFEFIKIHNILFFKKSLFIILAIPRVFIDLWVELV